MKNVNIYCIYVWDFAERLYDKSSIVMIIISACLFGFVIVRQEFCNRYINAIASCTLDVYLIHNNSIARNCITIGFCYKKFAEPLGEILLKNTLYKVNDTWHTRI